MRKINKDYARTPDVLTANRCKRKLKAIATSGAYSGETYKNGNVVTALNRLYHDKCGYCEAYIVSVSHKNVEHYRPKGAVESADLLAGTSHPGYYWLGNEWSNLLIACSLCNENGKKGIRFPLSDPSKRVNTHPPFLVNGDYNLPANNCHSTYHRNEDPLIINPETRNPRKYIRVTHSGELIEHRNSLRGKKTIEICDLNRNGLVIPRKTILDDIINEIVTKIHRHTQPVDALTPNQFRDALFDIFDKVIAGLHGTKPFTLVSKSIIKDFDNLILSHKDILPQFRPLIKSHFDEYYNV